ncbi:hypothetical protein KP509_09G085900 [Ceratopteris richardii]|uniref:Secreted protein n=1 Tax=Ceratopteris richardii TaxID=49495 RepID=A0A8T2U634_CERRI|nr:hypothetical protein KP509_09G085900 [Ceratopteris richardii]
MQSFLIVDLVCSAWIGFVPRGEGGAVICGILRMSCRRMTTCYMGSISLLPCSVNPHQFCSHTWDICGYIWLKKKKNTLKAQIFHLYNRTFGLKKTKKPKYFIYTAFSQ